MLESLPALILRWPSAHITVIMKNALESGIPDSLVESAVIDGANHYTILGKIVLPLSKPIMAT